MQPYSIKFCQFSKITSEKQGGALYLYVTNMNTVHIVHSYFFECIAPYEGGAIYCSTKNTTIEKCCFLACATKYYYGGNWGTAVDLFNTVASITSHVLIWKCNPDKSVYKGHVAYSLSGGANTIDHANMSECESQESIDGLHIIYSQSCIMSFTICLNNSKICTLYSRDTTSLQIDNCIFCYNVNIIATIGGTLGGSTPMTLYNSIFFQNEIDSQATNLKIYNCTTSSSSFGTALQYDGDCLFNIRTAPRIHDNAINCGIHFDISKNYTDKVAKSITTIIILFMLLNKTF